MRPVLLQLGLNLGVIWGMSVKGEIAMSWMTAAAIVVGSGLALSTAQAGEFETASPMRLNDQQLGQVTAAGTIFVGVARGDEVIFSRTIFNVPVTQERNRQIAAADLTIRLIATQADFLIPPLPFPQ
jgi:hypothetical protein